jgi:small-conductance mechanosensitive channel
MPFVPGRTRLAWILAFALTVAGWISAHELAYRLAIPHPHARSSKLAETGHAYFAYGSLVVALCLLVTLLCTASLVARPHGLRPPSRHLLLFIVLLPPLGFVLQELMEGLLTTGALPYEAALEPTFLLGILLQLPFALAALIVARALFAFARCLARRVASAGRPKLVSVVLSLPSLADLRLASLPALSFGYGERGPPLGSAP